jgi:NAD dependent epimerase/dehydratase family enzyme
MSWIALDDLIAGLHWALYDETIQGSINLVSPQPVDNRQFTKIFASLLRRPAILRIPAFILRAAFGQMADELLLCNARVVPQKLTASGFSFSFPDLESALRMELGKLEKWANSP